MKVCDLKPGDIVNIYGQKYTVKSVHTTGGSTTIFFEDALDMKMQPIRVSRYCDWSGYSAVTLNLAKELVKKYKGKLEGKKDGV